ncbi:hypothetical protein BX661DRAFT_87236 [Kickxella alabastrina]|uniref:uncharacterized protein n=1 Tax=Kickxella alabastrina TaxID=61397 RepID=UPI00221EC80B|nr:uncharacterized protein BX661DRAFT_87236 [Kickxella alabastrina]KAI7832062.1 hypothetical protein BX661DRAFT_87236 [Kickxella alabastrina]
MVFVILLSDHRVTGFYIDHMEIVGGAEFALLITTALFILVFKDMLSIQPTRRGEKRMAKYREKHEMMGRERLRGLEEHRRKMSTVGRFEWTVRCEMFEEEAESCFFILVWNPNSLHPQIPHFFLLYHGWNPAAREILIFFGATKIPFFLSIFSSCAWISQYVFSLCSSAAALDPLSAPRPLSKFLFFIFYFSNILYLYSTLHFSLLSSRKYIRPRKKLKFKHKIHAAFIFSYLQSGFGTL